MEPTDFRRVEPALNPALHSAYFLPDRAQIRNPRHLQALTASLSLQGASLRPGQAVVGFEVEGERIVAVRTSDERLPCGCVVVAAGPWSGALLEGAGVHAPTPPGSTDFTRRHKRGRNQTADPPNQPKTTVCMLDINE